MGMTLEILDTLTNNHDFRSVVYVDSSARWFTNHGNIVIDRYAKSVLLYSEDRRTCVPVAIECIINVY